MSFLFGKPAPPPPPPEAVVSVEEDEPQSCCTDELVAAAFNIVATVALIVTSAFSIVRGARDYECNDGLLHILFAWFTVFGMLMLVVECSLLAPCCGGRGQRKLSRAFVHDKCAALHSLAALRFCLKRRSTRSQLPGARAHGRARSGAALLLDCFSRGIA